MKVKTGKSHKYVGMNIDYTDNGTAKITMNDYLKEAITEFKEDCTAKARTPAATDLFTANDECPKLPEQKERYYIVL